jgi:hypothetical protein
MTRILKSLFLSLVAALCNDALAQDFVDVTASTRPCDYSVRQTLEVVEAPYLPVLSGRPVYLSLRGGGVSPSSGATTELQYFQIQVAASESAVHIKARTATQTVVPNHLVGNCVEVPVSFFGTGEMQVRYDIDVFFFDLVTGLPSSTLLSRETFSGIVNVTGSGLTYPVPTFSQYTLAAFALLVAMFAGWRLRKRLPVTTAVTAIFAAAIILAGSDQTAHAQIKLFEFDKRPSRHHIETGFGALQTLS